MYQIEKITTKLRRPSTTGVFHDSRADVRTLSAVCNELIHKVNELTNVVNILMKKSNE